MTRTIDFKLWEDGETAEKREPRLPREVKRRKKRVIIAGDRYELRGKKDSESDSDQPDKKAILENYVPDSRTGELQPKHVKHEKRPGGRKAAGSYGHKSEGGYGGNGKSEKGKKKSGEKRTEHIEKAGKSEKKKTAEDATGRKVYAVHKYKKSATSKAARSAQGKRN